MYLNPLRVAILAPPQFLQCMLGTQGYDYSQTEQTKLFNVHLQILLLEQFKGYRALPESSYCDHLIKARPWRWIFFNEGSSPPDHSLIEDLEEAGPPSVINDWAVSYPQSPASDLHEILKFTYCAVFPTYRHLKRTLAITMLMKNIGILHLQLTPQNSHGGQSITNQWNEDVWQELWDCYALIISTLRNSESIYEFRCLDFANEIFQEKIGGLLILWMSEESRGPWKWVARDMGVWTLHDPNFQDPNFQPSNDRLEGSIVEVED